MVRLEPGHHATELRVFLVEEETAPELPAGPRFTPESSSQGLAERGDRLAE